MAYKKDIKPWLKSEGLTWEDMDRLWNECCEVNKKCEVLRRADKNWSDLPMRTIRQIPTLKEETLQKQKEAEEARIRQEEHDRKVAEEKKYFAEHFDEIILKQIDDGEEVDSRHIRELVFNNSVENIYGENRRWSRSVTTIFELCGRYFSIDWEEGLTECQDNEFYNQPVEVFRNTKVVVTLSNSWDSKTEEVVSTGDCVSQLSSWLLEQKSAVNKIEFENRVK